MPRLFGYCHLPIVALRAEASQKSEMISQVLFGEHFQIEEIIEDEWIKIKLANDDYSGWLSFKQFRFISEAEYQNIHQNNFHMCCDLWNVLTDAEFGEMQIPFGARLPFLENKQFKIQNKNFTYSGQSRHLENIQPNRENIVKIAKQFLNVPYLWGGKSILGIDCSGLTQLIYQTQNILLPRDAYMQAELGMPLSFVEEAQAGDLAFFDNTEGRITHVGILLDSNTIIHASGQVRIDKIDHYGIFHSEKKKYSHLLRVIKNVID
jgi:gamma-D-glutamyl-L-lysine dipeptidyl-peptidase